MQTITYIEVNPDSLEDLYECCLTALGAYEGLKELGLDIHFPGYSSCVDDLKAALSKAGYNYNKDK